MAAFAYLRISTSSQDLQKNKYDILEFANSNGLGTVEFTVSVIFFIRLVFSSHFFMGFSFVSLSCR